MDISYLYFIFLHFVCVCNCSTDSDEIQNANAETFYQSLSEQLRSQTPGNIWLRYENLLNFALSIIGFEKFDYLFRGERCCQTSVSRTATEGTIFIVHRFWSTTLDPTITNLFGGDEYMFYIIRNGKGVDIQHIAATDFEKEVLIASSAVYLIERIISCEIEIKREMEKLQFIYPGFDAASFKPNTMIILQQINT